MVVENNHRLEVEGEDSFANLAKPKANTATISMASFDAITLRIQHRHCTDGLGRLCPAPGNQRRLLRRGLPERVHGRQTVAGPDPVDGRPRGWRVALRDLRQRLRG